MHKLTIIPLIILSLMCKPEGTTADDPEIKANLEKQKKGLEESKMEILKNKKDTYKISFGSITPELAVEKFLFDLEKNEDYTKNVYLFSTKENEEVLYPNTYGFGTSLDVTPLPQYRELIARLTSLGYLRIRETIGGGKIKKVMVKFGKERVYNSITGYKPVDLEIEIEGKIFHIEQIKMVMKVGNLYKVAVVTP